MGRRIGRCVSHNYSSTRILMRYVDSYEATLSTPAIME